MNLLSSRCPSNHPHKHALKAREPVIMIELSLTVVEHSVVLLESNALRSLDALHIGCALEWEADRFVSSDKRQIKAAKKSGLKTIYIGND